MAEMGDGEMGEADVVAGYGAQDGYVLQHLVH